MNRERVRRYLKRTGLAVAALSAVTMAIDNVATSTAADNKYPQTISFTDRQNADQTILAAREAIEKISIFVPEESRSNLRVTVESSPQVTTAKKTVDDYNQRSTEHINYKAELRGNRELWESLGVIGGLTIAAVGNVVAYWRRGAMVAPARR